LISGQCESPLAAPYVFLLVFLPQPSFTTSHVLNDPSPRRNVLSCSDYSQSSHCIKSQRGGVVFIKDKLAHNKIAMA
jgi:hypothetical protein